ncbi:ESPR-type extended signal peptide-containing protein, partial [Chromobacterium haemolyticum]|uniref:ESPR-type extended signal peptide-containing protein n=1 Tax=Chromobacterium haemolyticum TaxID=394935 RepID=UPI001F07D6D7
MNKIYRVIWSAVTQQWVTVSELAPARGKSRSAVCASVVALTMGIGASFTSNAMPVVIAKPGETVELGETVVSSEGGSIRADSTVQARGVDAIIITNDTTITADGQAVSAVYALNGGRVEINGGKLVTGESNRLKDSHAVVASSDGKVVIKNAEINTYGQNGAGASTEGGSVELTDTKIKTALGPGVRSTSKSGELVMNGGSIDSGGYGAYAELGGQLTLNDVTVVSQGVGALANSGSTITINGGSFETNGNNAYGLYANNPNNSFIDLSSEKKTEILTSGVRSHGAYVLSSRIKLNGDSIKTTGDNAYGLYALGNKKGDAVISAAQAEVVTTGVGAHAVRAMNSDAMVEVIGLTVVKEDGSEEVKKSSITTTGENSNGLYASSGAYINAAQATITTSGVSSAGAAATTGSKIDLNSVEIETTGQAASGLWVDNAQINADDVTIKTYGEPGKSTASTGASLFNGASLLLSNSSIETLKDKGMGVDVLSGSNATLINSSITTHGDLSTGVAAWNASANLDQVVINTSGQNARGVVSRGDTASVLVAGSTLNTEGQGSYGIHATEGGKASVNGSQLQTAGDQAYGVAAIENSAVQLTDSTVRTDGASASLYAKQGSRIDMEGGSIVANHAMGRAIEFSSQQGLEDVIRLDGTQVAAAGTAISAHGDGVSRLELANSTVASASGSLLLVNESGIDQRFVLDASNSQLSGDALVDKASQAEINLAKQSNWQGKASGLGALSVSEDSVWNITGSSDVAALNLQGTAAFAAPTSGDFKTLTVKSDYVG